MTCPLCPAVPAAGAVIDVRLQPALLAAVRGGLPGTCPHCQAPVPDPQLTWIDPGHGQWIAAFPRSHLDRWREHEADAQARFAAAGPAITGLRPRVAFGWPGLRELAVAAEAGLDDVRLELLKLLLMRGMDPPLPLRAELRLTAAATDSLDLDVFDHAGAALESLSVPREMIAQIESDPDGWESLRSQLVTGPFTDVLRLWRA